MSLAHLMDAAIFVLGTLAGFAIAVVVAVVITLGLLFVFVSLLFVFVVITLGLLFVSLLFVFVVDGHAERVGAPGHQCTSGTAARIKSARAARCASWAAA